MKYFNLREKHGTKKDRYAVAMKCGEHIGGGHLPRKFTRWPQLNGDPNYDTITNIAIGRGRPICML